MQPTVKAVGAERKMGKPWKGGRKTSTQNLRAE